MGSRRSITSAPGRRPSQTSTDSPGSGRAPLVVDSTTPTSANPPAPIPTTMPPPRETKTLASVREKLRAKRLLMSQQQPCTPIPAKVPCQQQQLRSVLPTPVSSYDPPPQPPPAATGSLTPNPGTSNSGDFYSCPSSTIAVTAISSSTTTHEAVPPIFASVMQSPTVLIQQPTGNSVSAPATPQHGSTGTGLSGPLPAILANFKQARVVVTPSRSGSSVSSNEGASELPDSDQQIPEASSQPQIIQPQQQQLQPIQQKAMTSQQLQPLVAGAANACNVGGASSTTATTTTRAFFVDRNNLSETLALLQSMHPRPTVTQQQFLLIPSTDKSHAILCRTPIAIQPKQVPLQQQAPTQLPQAQIIRRPSGSTAAPQASGSTASTPTVLPLILPATSRSQDHQQQQVPAIPPGLYREILPNNNINNSTNTSVCNVQRMHQQMPIQPQSHQQQAAQVRRLLFQTVPSQWHCFILDTLDGTRQDLYYFLFIYLFI